jgi:DNA-binding NarL/FixJ family response regulator
MKAPVKVMLVDDHAVVRTGYRRLLDDEPDLWVCSEHGDADEAYVALGQGLQPQVDVMVLDLSMPGRSGLALLRRAKLRWPGLRVLVFSMHDNPAMVAQAFKAGAQGYVTKSSEPAVLVQVLRQVARGDAGVCSPDVATAGLQPLAQPPHVLLSVREFEVLRGLVQGLTVDQIAEQMHLSSKTVSNYQTQIRQRLGVSTAVDLLRYAQVHQLYSP